MKEIHPSILLAAYRQGVFPMAHPELDDEVYWYAPDPRGIIPVEGFHCPRRLKRTVDQGPFDVRYSTAFGEVIRACAAPREIGAATWISQGIVDAYCQLHQMGYAHSVEAWRGGELVGGLYGVALGGLFAGESMFFRATDASKVCLVHLVRRLRERGFVLLDVQFVNAHLEQFGAVEIARDEYERRLEAALAREVAFL